MSETPKEPEPAPEASPEQPAEERMALPSWSRARTKKRGDGGVTKDDAFQGAVRSAGRAAISRGRWVVLGIVAIAVAIGGIVIYRADHAQKSATATKLLATAAAHEARAVVGDPASLVDQGVPPFPVVADEAARGAVIAAKLAELEEVAPGSGPRNAAELLKAAALLRDGDFSGAEATYRGILRDEAHPLGFLAREGVALALEGQGDVDGALRQLEILAGDPGAIYRESALYHRARILAAQGRHEEAVAALKTYIAEYPLREFSLLGEEIRRLVEEVDPSLLSEDEAAPSAVSVVDGASPPAPAGDRDPEDAAAE